MTLYVKQITNFDDWFFRGGFHKRGKTGLFGRVQQASLGWKVHFVGC